MSVLLIYSGKPIWPLLFSGHRVNLPQNLYEIYIEQIRSRVSVKLYIGSSSHGMETEANYLQSFHPMYDTLTLNVHSISVSISIQTRISFNRGSSNCPIQIGWNKMGVMGLVRTSFRTHFLYCILFQILVLLFSSAGQTICLFFFF